MKQYVTMQKIKQFDMYKCLEYLDYRFVALWGLLADHFKPGVLINWLADETNNCENNEYVCIVKESHIIVLYDITAMRDPMYVGSSLIDWNPLHRFEMTIQNFTEIIFLWENLRVSRPDVFLIVIHEDNYVSLETDPVIMQQYQDSGYVFDIKKEKRLENFLLLKIFEGHLSATGHAIFSPLFCLHDYFLNKHYPGREVIFESEEYCYRDEVKNMVYIGSFDWDEFKQKKVPDMDNIAEYVNEYNSNIMSSENLVALDYEWLAMAQSGKQFGILYQNEHGWFHAQSFATESEMYDFVKNYRAEL